jgi:hypothetical protein
MRAGVPEEEENGMDVGIPWSSSSSSSGACGSSLARPLLTGQGLSTGAVRVVQIDSTASASAREREAERDRQR